MQCLVHSRSSVNDGYYCCILKGERENITALGIKAPCYGRNTMCRGTLQKVKVRKNDRLDMREKQVGKKIEFQVYFD